MDFSMNINEVKQLIEHHYFELENNKGISDALNEYSISLSNILMRVDDEVNNIMSDFESYWINDQEKMTGISKKYLNFLKTEIEKDIVSVVSQQLKYWSRAKRVKIDSFWKQLNYVVEIFKKCPALFLSFLKI